MSNLLPILPEHFNVVTLRFPLRYGLPCVAGKWKRLEDGRIETKFTQEEISAMKFWAVFDLVPAEFEDEPVSKSIWNPKSNKRPR